MGVCKTHFSFCMYVRMFVGCCLATKSLNITRSGMGGGGNGCGSGFVWDNVQQISYIPKTEQHSPFGLMLLRLVSITYVKYILASVAKVVTGLLKLSA